MKSDCSNTYLFIIGTICHKMEAIGIIQFTKCPLCPFTLTFISQQWKIGFEIRLQQHIPLHHRYNLSHNGSHRNHTIFGNVRYVRLPSLLYLSNGSSDLKSDCSNIYLFIIGTICHIMEAIGIIHFWKCPLSLYTLTFISQHGKLRFEIRLQQHIPLFHRYNLSYNGSHRNHTFLEMSVMSVYPHFLISAIEAQILNLIAATYTSSS